MSTSIKVKQGTTVSLRYDADGNLWVDGLEPVTPEPESIAAVVRFKSRGVDMCAFKVNADSGPNFRITSTTGDFRRWSRFDGNEMVKASWDEITKRADEGTLRVYQPTKQEPSPSSVGSVQVDTDRLTPVF